MPSSFIKTWVGKHITESLLLAKKTWNKVYSFLKTQVATRVYPSGRLVGGLSFHLFIYVQLNFMLKFIYVAAQTFIK
jgi:hypothetical protein